MLFAMAVGDAYGAGFEYASADFVSANHTLAAYVQHRKHDLLPGSYTDDTQMSIANAEVICSFDVTRERLAQAYVDCFKRDRRLGYAGGFYRFLCEVVSGTEFLSRINPNSDKSGGAMRALPFGIYPDVETVISMATLQAAITHDTPSGISAAVAAALISHFFLYDLGYKSELGGFIERYVPGAWAEPWSGPVGEKGWMSVRAAITAIMSADSMTEILRKSVDFTGDVDTVAALALGAAAASAEVDQDLPDVLVQGLENGTYGGDFLRALDRRLAQKMWSLRQAPQTPPQPALVLSLPDECPQFRHYEPNDIYLGTMPNPRIEGGSIDLYARAWTESPSSMIVRYSDDRFGYQLCYAVSCHDSGHYALIGSAPATLVAFERMIARGIRLGVADSMSSIEKRLFVNCGNDTESGGERSCQSNLFVKIYDSTNDGLLLEWLATHGWQQIAPGCFTKNEWQVLVGSA